MIAANWQPTELATTPVTHQAPASEKKNDRVDQSNRAQHTERKPVQILAEQIHRHGRRQNDNSETSDLWKILASEKLAATARRTTPQITLIVTGAIPLKMNLTLASRQLYDTWWTFQIDIDRAQ